LAGSQAPALDVLHKCYRPVIPAGMPESSVQGWQTSSYGKPRRKIEVSRPCDWIPASLLEWRRSSQNENCW